MGESEKTRRFAVLVMPHISAAYNLARWLVHETADAEDVVQEACLRAFRFIEGFRGEDGRAWFLAIVRNTSYTWLRQNRAREMTVPFDELALTDGPDPENVVLQKIDSQLLRKSMQRLPIEYREVIVLRDVEGMSYKDIAKAVEIPVGTVMSRLARGRRYLQLMLVQTSKRELD